MIRTVNLATVYAKVAARGLPVAMVASRLLAMDLSPEPFTEGDARITANLYTETQSLGLSLGDRACLGAAKRLGLPVLTADRAWRKARVGVEIQLLRT